MNLMLIVSKPHELLDRLLMPMTSMNCKNFLRFLAVSTDMKDHRQLRMRHVSFRTVKSQFEHNDDGMKEGPLSANVFSDVLEKGNLAIYKWFNTNYHQFILPESYKLIYSRCLIDHIVFTEEHVPRIKKDDPIGTRVSTADLRKFCFMTNIDSSQINLKMITNYTNWLISMGRSCGLDSEVFISLVRRLMNSDEVRTAKRLLVSLLLASPGTQKACLGKLLVQNDKLINLLGESGLMDIVTAHEMMIEIDSPLLIRHWILSENDRKVRLAFELLRHQCKNLSEERSVVKNVCTLDDETNGSISELILTIAVAVSWNSSEIFSGFIFPRLAGLDRDQTREFYRNIVVRAPPEMIQDFHSRTVDADHELFVRAANDVLIDTDIALTRGHSSFILLRAATIIRILRHEADIFVFRHAAFDQENQCDLLMVLIGEISSRIEREDSAVLRVFGDKCLHQLWNAKHHSPSSTKTYSNCFGERCLRALMKEKAGTLEDFFAIEILRPRLVDYVSSHLNEFLVNILKSLESGHSWSLPRLDSIEILGASFRLNRKLNLGSKLYEFTRYDHGRLRPYSNEILTASVWCAGGCRKPVVQSNGIFILPTDPHGLYYCSDCASKDSRRIRPTCNICLCNDEDLEMKIIKCYHCYCTECLTQLMGVRSTGQCPACRSYITRGIPESTPSLSFVEAVTIFIREWNESPADCIEASRITRQSIDDAEEDEFDLELE